MWTQVAMLLLVVVLLGARSGAEEVVASAQSDRDLLRSAFERTLHAPGVRSVELRVYRGGQLVSRRAFDVAYRRDSENARSLLRFTAPNYLRGHALLVLETPEGVSDTWLYQAEERRPRRVGTAHKADSFYGSDLSFEELEHQRFEHFELRRLPDASEGGVPCAVIEAVPQRDSQYGRLVAWIDRVRTGVTRVDFYRGSDTEPSKRLRVALGEVVEEAGFLRIQHMRIEQIGREAWTDVETSRMVIDPAISPEAFSASLLEREGEDLYALVGRHAAIGDEP
jgi:Outer membrane lipoprotein-sorting protein